MKLIAGSLISRQQEPESFKKDTPYLLSNLSIILRDASVIQKPLNRKNMSKEISVVVLIQVKPGQREDQINAFNEIKPLVLAEDGCLQYELKADIDNINRFVMIERWASEEALDAHFKATHMVEAAKTKHLYRAKLAEIIRLSDS